MIYLNHLLRASAAILALCVPARADALADLASFSAFKVDLDKLAGGAVQSARGAPTSFSRGLSVESLYVVRKPLSKTAELHLQWDPTRHPELKIYLHGDLSAHPKAAEFQKLGAAPSNGSVKSLVAATQKLGSGPTELQLSHAEAKAFATTAPGANPAGGGLPANITAFWMDVLFRRAQAFAAGGADRLPPYETGPEIVRPAEEIARLLKDAPKVRRQFGALIDASPLTGGKAGAPELYWEMCDVEGQAALTLGAVSSRTAGETWQALDGQYYASGGYHVFLTFYQLWPVKIAGQECTLVWRGDLISSASLATLHGVERMGSSTAVMRGTKKNIETLLKDAAKAP